MFPYVSILAWFMADRKDQSLLQRSGRVFLAAHCRLPTKAPQGQPLFLGDQGFKLGLAADVEGNWLNVLIDFDSGECRG